MQNEKILVYPDLQEIMEKAPNLLVAIIRYKDEIERIINNPDRVKKWKNDKEADKAVVLYSKFWNVLERYYTADKDMLARETVGEKAYISPFFKSLPEPVSEKNPHISFSFSSRLKSWSHFVEKAITLVEDDARNWNPNKISEQEYHFRSEKIYDIHAIKAKVHTDKIISVEKRIDYPNAISDCYDIMNSFAEIACKNGASPLLPTNVGTSSEAILEEYRPYMKDYIQNPKPNGYQAVHCSFEKEVEIAQLVDGKKVKTKKNIIFELQVKSKLMEILSKDGGAWCHKQHKANTKLPLGLDLTRIHYPDFEAYLDSNGNLIIDDDAGVEIGKEITKIRTYQKKI